MKITVKKIFNELIYPLLKIAYIAIIFDGKKAYVCTKIVKNGEILENHNKVFDVDTDKVSKLMSEYINHIYSKTTYSYIATIMFSINQGAIHKASDSEYIKMGIELDSLVRTCINKEWSIYSNIYEIDKIHKRFEHFHGVDFIFTPETVLFYAKENKPESVLYVLNRTNGATFIIFKGNSLIYSSNFIFTEENTTILEETKIDSFDHDDQNDDSSDDDVSYDDKTSVLDDIDSIEQVDDLDNLADLDDMDKIEDLDNFVIDASSSNLETVDSDDDDDLESLISADMSDDGDDYGDNLKKDLLLFEFLENSLNDYYKSEFYASEFITKCVIYDATSKDTVIRKHLYDKFFIESTVLNIDIPELICDMAIEEVKNAI